MIRPTVLLVLALAACRATSTYTGVGDVVEIDETKRQVTIDHDDIPGLMGAMRMAFPVRSPEVFARATPGTRVRFELAHQGQELVITAITRVDEAVRQVQPGSHSHAPLHGGAVTMVGMLHLETVASKDGRVRVYLTDVWRRPLALDQVTGTVSLDLPGGPWSGALRAGAEALEADAPPLHDTEVVAHVLLTRDGSPIEAYVSLPLGGAGGSAGPEAMRCLPAPVAAGAEGGAPRCAFDFGFPVTTIAATPEGGTVLVGVEEGSLTAWRLPEGGFVSAFEAPPAPADGPPPQHQSWGAIAVSPDGREAVVGMRRRLLRYAVGSGRLLRELPVASGLVRELAWSRDGTRIGVTSTFDPAAHLLGPRDGEEVRRLEIEGEPTAVALAPDGAAAAVATGAGPIAVFDLATADPPRMLSGPSSAVRALDFAGGRLVSAGDDGVLRIWDVAAGRLAHEATIGSPTRRLAIRSEGRVVACAGADGVIALHDVGTGAAIERLDWHRRTVTGLVWVGSILVSGDVQGRMALWDVTAPQSAPTQR